MDIRRKYSKFFIGIVGLFAFLLLLVENTEFGDNHPRTFQYANAGIWLLFITDVSVRFFWSKKRWDYFRRHWFEMIVFVPLFQYLPVLYNPEVFTVIRQTIIVAVLISRISRVQGLLELLQLKPTQLMLTGFLGAIGVGSIFLMLPIATTSGERMPLIDAVFTATSAVCVTGLIVEDTATYFSVFGQLVILALIQVGGLGIMTFSVVLAMLLGKRMDLGQRTVLRETLDRDSLSGTKRLIRFIVLMTVAFEFIGAVFLFIFWRNQFDSTVSAAYHALFHAVSAFCNAGFSTFTDSLMAFQADTGVNITIAALIIFGGLGFMVIQNLSRRFQSGPGKASARIHTQTKIVLTATILLLCAGTVLIYLTERSALLQNLSPTGSLLAAFFQSVTTRTAGFNTVDIKHLAPSTLFPIIVLMFIGASPGSTGGGIKTTTVATLWAAMIASVHNRPHVEIYRRTIPTDTVYKALTVVWVSFGLVATFTFALLYTEEQPFLDILFETVSAFGTVGLSMGLTADLSVAGRVMITLLMFIGRLGPLTIAFALMPTGARGRYKYAEERIMIG